VVRILWRHILSLLPHIFLYIPTLITTMSSFHSALSPLPSHSISLTPPLPNGILSSQLDNNAMRFQRANASIFLIFFLRNDIKSQPLSLQLLEFISYQATTIDICFHNKVYKILGYFQNSCLVRLTISSSKSFIWITVLSL
jgi:hypothetical protein